MGPKLSLPSSSRSIQQTPFHHQRFLNTSSSAKGNYLRSIIPFRDSNALKQWSEMLEYIKNAEYQPEEEKQFLMLPRKWRVLEEGGMCSSYGKLELEFQMYYSQLEDEMAKRKIEGKYFDQCEMWYLLYALVTTAKVFSEKKLAKIGDIRPHNIFINQSGFVRVITVLSFPSQTDNYAKYLIERIPTFLSPEQMHDIHLSHQINPNSPILSESFSIGMTMLSMGLLDLCQDIYDVDKGEMRLEPMRQRIEEWEKLDHPNLEQKQSSPQKNPPQTVVQKVKYSSPLKDVVTKMLAFNINERVSSLEVYQWLLPYRDAIYRQENLQIEPIKVRNKTTQPTSHSAPQKLQQNNIPQGKGLIPQNKGSVPQGKGSVIKLKSKKRIEKDRQEQNQSNKSNHNNMQSAGSTANKQKHPTTSTPIVSAYTNTYSPSPQPSPFSYQSPYPSSLTSLPPTSLPPTSLPPTSLPPTLLPQTFVPIPVSQSISQPQSYISSTSSSGLDFLSKIDRQLMRSQQQFPSS